MKGSFLIVLFLVLGEGVFSQIAKEDFAKINKTYADQPQLCMKMKYEVFKNKTTSTVFQTESGEIKKNNTGKYTRVGKVETIETETYRLIVDNEDKNMTLLGISKDVESGVKQENTYMLDVEKMLGMCNSVTFKKINEDQNSYLMELPDQEYGAIKFFYNTKTHYIEKMILYYNEEQRLDEKTEGSKEAPRIEISYFNFTTEGDFKETVFSYDKYLEDQNGKLVSKPAYKNYTVNDQRLSY